VLFSKQSPKYSRSQEGFFFFFVFEFYAQLNEVFFNRRVIEKYLSLPPVKLHCSMLAEDAIKAAVKDYEAKRAKSNGSTTAEPAVKTAEA
jgi:hypothetical protein